MKCKYCGKNIEDGAPFCAYCGNMQNPQVPVQNEGTPNKNKGANIALGIAVVILALAVCAGAVTAAVAYRKTKNFRGYVASYEEKQNEFWSLAGHDDEYAEYLDEANSLADKYKFWAYEEQREKMEALCDEISDLNDSIAEYREAYDKTIEEMESDGKYYFGDYADDYEEAKEECLDAMKDFDERKSKKNTEALEELAEEIKDYNVSEGEKMQDEANSATSAYDFLSCERYLINDAKNKITEAYEAGNYADERAQYENFCEQVSHFTESASRVINAYSQVDVSDNNLVRVYFNYDDDENWNTDDFVVYELKEGTDFWQACQLSNIEQIKGHMTMDIVADISDSMEYQFDDMKNSVVSFTNSTTSDTYLGLSTIGSVYTREQEFTQDKNIIRNSVNSLECYGLTSLYQSLYSSVLYTATASGSRCVVAFTDGMNVPYGTGYDYDIEDVIDVSLTYQIPIYVIGVGNSIDSNALREIADRTGGFYRYVSWASDLDSIYQEIYARQQKTYQLTYTSSLPNNANRQIYVYGDNINGNVQVRLEQDVEAEILSNAYSDSAERNLAANDLAEYYTDELYLSQLDLHKITDVKEIQKIINIYFAKNGLEFGNEDVLNEMISLGVISQNGTRSADEALKSIMSNPTLYRNYMALYNYRYELFYNMGYDVYFNEGIKDKDSFVNRICAIINETNTSRFMDIRKVYSALVR